MSGAAASRGPDDRLPGSGWLPRVRWVVPAVGAGLLLDGLLRPPAGARPIDRGSFAVLMGLLTWFGWLVGQTALRVDDDGLRVTNFGRFHRIPWSAVQSVREDQEVVVTLRSGRKIRLFAAAGLCSAAS